MSSAACNKKSWPGLNASKNFLWCADQSSCQWWHEASGLFLLCVSPSLASRPLCLLMVARCLLHLQAAPASATLTSALQMDRRKKGSMVKGKRGCARKKAFRKLIQKHLLILWPELGYTVLLSQEEESYEWGLSQPINAICYSHCCRKGAGACLPSRRILFLKCILFFVSPILFQEPCERCWVYIDEVLVAQFYLYKN